MSAAREVTRSPGIDTVAACVAVVIPALLAFNVPPSATFLNQAVAFFGWGGFVAWIGWRQRHTAADIGIRGPVAAVLLSLGLLGLAALAAFVFQGLPSSLALSSLGTLAATALVFASASSLRDEAERERAFATFAGALSIAGLLSLLIVLVQYFRPEWADGVWIATSAVPSRPGGNLRQPNHLATLLLLCVASNIWLIERINPDGRGSAKAMPVVALTLALTFGAAMTASRTGALCCVLLAGWGATDRSLSRTSRFCLLMVPLCFAASWLGLSELAKAGQHAFGGDSQLHRSDISSSRFGIWGNALSLLAAHPFVGVGWGEFNFAWTLTPFPGRPGAFFDHTHNLPLQLLVEMGIPAGLCTLGLILWACWKGLVAGVAAVGAPKTTLRCAFAMILMLAIHSQLEYPLWYAYFLLPLAFALGICLSAVPSHARPASSATARLRGASLCAAGWILSTGALLAVADYQRVVQIFQPRSNAASLADRIESGQRSIFFAHHADYAAVTTVAHPSEAMSAFRGAPHYLLDTRLMIAWARGLDESGEVQRARYVAARLREFRNPASEEFFAPCLAPSGTEAKPFQCQEPEGGPLSFRDFR